MMRQDAKYKLLGYEEIVPIAEEDEVENEDKSKEGEMEDYEKV